MTKAARSKVALWISGIYLLFALGSWVLPLIAKPGENMAAIFLMLFAQPWAGLWLWVTDTLKIDNFVLNMLVMLAGILLNTWVLYRVFSWVSRR